MLKVLLVDDEPHIVHGLKAIIDWEQEGFEVTRSCSNGREALDYLRDNPVDLVIADIKMPVMSGLELLEKIRTSGISDAYFVIVSGYADFKFAQQAIRYKCSDYLLKPVDRDNLREVVRKVHALSYKKNEQLSSTRKMESAYFSQNIIPIIRGKFDEINIEYVEKHMRTSESLRYIELQVRSDKEAEDSTDGEKRLMQRKLYKTVTEYLGENDKCCIFDPSGHDKIFDVGMVFFDYMSDELEISEKELKHFFESLPCYFLQSIL